MEELQIGTAEIIYGEDGKVLRAFFTPKMQVGNIASQLLQLEPGKPERIKENAEMVLAAWFSKMNEIELADREHYKIESEILKCTMYQDGSVKRCKISFTFKEMAY